jgi:hypothetical protein
MAAPYLNSISAAQWLTPIDLPICRSLKTQSIRLSNILNGHAFLCILRRQDSGGKYRQASDEHKEPAKVDLAERGR